MARRIGCTEGFRPRQLTYREAAVYSYGIGLFGNHRQSSGSAFPGKRHKPYSALCYRRIPFLHAFTIGYGCPLA